MKNLIKPIIILILLILGVYYSYETVVVHSEVVLNLESSNSLCGASEDFDCAKIAKSDYSSIFGIPLGSYGVAFYGFFGFIVFYLILKGKDFHDYANKLLFLPFFFSIIFSVFLFFVSKFVVKTLCPLCLVLYVINFLIFFIVLFNSESLNIVKRLVNSLKFYIKILISAFNDVKHLNKNNIFDVMLVILALVLFIFFGYVLENLLISKTKYNESAKAVIGWPKNQKIDIDLKLDNSSFGDYYKGNIDAPIEIVKFADFECPYCRTIGIELENLLENYKDKYYFVYKNYPLDNSCNKYMPKVFHKNACFASNYSRCAGEQGRFWESYSFLNEFEDYKLDNKSMVRELLMQGVLELNLDTKAFVECLDSKRQIDVIKNDIEQAVGLQIKGTPTFFINGKKVENPSPLIIKEILDSLL